MASNCEKERAESTLVSSLPRHIRLICWILKAMFYIGRRSDGTLNRTLEAWMIPKVPANETLTRGVYTKDTVIDEATGVWIRLFVSVNGEDEKGALPVVVYFHGGGFCVLSASNNGYDIFCRRLAKRRRVVVVSVEYRLAPENKCPAAYDDCFAALAWLRARGRDYLPPSADLSRCFLMGDSAGGNIVHHIGCRVAGEDMSPIKIVGHVLIQPFFGGDERTPAEVRLKDGAPFISLDAADWCWKAFLPVGATRDHPAANVTRADISGLSLPPSLVVVGGLDLLQDWQLRYAEHLKTMGKQAEILFYEDGVHGFHVFPYYLSSKFIDDLRHFLQTP
jgi:gibberellin receptor GID1